MADTTLNNIRLSLKYDTLANWNASSLVLNVGEVGIAIISDSKTLIGDTNQTPQNTPPTVGLKVGDGTHTFSQLPWLQAVAGDVYAWAKAATKPTYTASEISNLSDYISGQINDTDTQYKIVLDGTTVKLMSKAKGEADTAYAETSSFVLPTYTLTSGTTNGTVSFNGAEVAVTGLKSAAYTESSAYATAAQGTKAETAMPKTGGTFTGAVSGIAPTDDANLTTKAYVDAQIKANAASVFKFKGTVANTSALPTASADIEGNVYHVTDDHGEYVCVKVDGSGTYTWEPLGGVIDLSDYALSADVIQRVSNSEGFVPKFNANGTLASTGFTLGKSVPADAVFTDTKVSNIANSTGKVFTGLTGNTTISTTNVGKLVLEGFAVSADSGNIVATDTISTALNKIYNLANSKTSNTGTVTSVTISNGGGLKVNNSTVTTSGTITISHGDKPTTGTATTNSGRTYIQNITLDTYGHVAGVTTATETVVDTGITSVTANNGLNANVANRSLTLGINSISTDLLINGANTLVLNCGTSAV